MNRAVNIQRTVMILQRGFRPCFSNQRLFVPHSWSGCRQDRHFHIGCATPIRFRNHRRKYRNSNRGTDSSGNVEIDRYVKHLKYGGAICIRSPFLVEVAGSYFDEENEPDTHMNARMTEVYQMQHNEELFANHVPEAPREKSEDKAKSKEEMKAAVKGLTEVLQEHITRGEESQRQRETDQSDDDEDDDEETSPVHVSIYGRPNLETESNSVVNQRAQQHTYVYLKDADRCRSEHPQHHEGFPYQRDIASFKEALVDSSAMAYFTLWEPNYQQEELENDGALSPLDEVFSSSLRFFSFDNIFESSDFYTTSAYCLVPTYLNKIFMQAESTGRIVLDGTLIDGLERVGLTSDIGSIRVTDLTAYDIKVSSKLGDIYMDGIIEGSVHVETGEDGEITLRGKRIFGPTLSVNSQLGDIIVRPEVHSDVCHIKSECANIKANKIYSAHTKINVTDKGNVYAKMSGGGKFEVMVNKGIVDIEVGEGGILDNSYILVFNGQINLLVPQKNSFRLKVSSPMTKIAPQLLNMGELTLSEVTGNEEFSTMDSLNEDDPVLEIAVHQGSVNLFVADVERDKVLKRNSDSNANLIN